MRTSMLGGKELGVTDDIYCRAGPSGTIKRVGKVE